MSVRLRSRLPALALLAVLITACAARGPQPGATWTIDAVDRAGTYGTITITRGEVIELPAPALAAIPGATRGILVHVSYAPDRPNNTGMGPFDWGAAVGDEEVDIAGARVRVLGLHTGADWPVEPTLGTKIAGSDDALEGWFAIAVSLDELAQPVTLRYQPLLVDLGNNASDNQLVSEVVVLDP
jgi:hypothetical protein